MPGLQAAHHSVFERIFPAGTENEQGLTTSQLMVDTLAESHEVFGIQNVELLKTA